MGDDLDHEMLDSDDDDLRDQDKFKGINLGAITNVRRNDMSVAQRRNWLNSDIFENKYMLLMDKQPERDTVRRRFNVQHKESRKLVDTMRGKNEI